jgi:tetratricopeptide (TPR) repeat protein
VPHNHHFLWFAASMVGESEIARSAARHTAERVNLPELMREPGFASLQHFWMTPWFDDVRFGRWEEIAARPNPAPDLPYVTLMWHYAQGMAAVRQDRAGDADQHLAAIRKILEDPVLETLTVWGRYPLTLASRIAERVVTAEIALTRNDSTAAIAALREAVAIEDTIPYDEPPGWHAPVRQTLGAALLATGKPAEAESVYREELRRNPENGWSLKGLERSLVAQRKEREAHEIEQRFATAWSNADVALEGSRL